MTDRTVICAGHVNWDVTLYVDRLPDPDSEAMIIDQQQAGGGSASNTAFVLSTLGLQSALLGSTGDDEYGSLVRTDLQRAGVDCTSLETIADAVTTVKYIVVDESGEVVVLANDGANEAFSHEAVTDERLRNAAHLHLTGQCPQTARRLSNRALEAGVPLSFDPGRRLDVREYESVYRHADIVFLNEAEGDIAREKGLFEEIDGLVVVKKGSAGASVLDDGEWIAHPGFDTDPIDTTGAGDAFAAGFIAALLNNRSLGRALAVGNACGALSTGATGARTAISWEDVNHLLDGTE